MRIGRPLRAQVGAGFVSPGIKCFEFPIRIVVPLMRLPQALSLGFVGARFFFSRVAS